MKALDIVKWNRALNEIRYKHNELEIIKELSGKYSSLFDQEVKKYCKKYDIDMESLGQQTAKKVTQQEASVAVEVEKNKNKDDEETKEIFRKMFKKLAMHLHPDRHYGLSEEEKEYRLELFKEARAAYNEERYFVLLDLFEKYKVGLPKNYKQQTRWMLKKIEELDTDIENYKNSFTYLYSECETEDEKEKVVAMFVFQIMQQEKKPVDIPTVV
jgi:hypothetical protein